MAGGGWLVKMSIYAPAAGLLLRRNAPNATTIPIRAPKVGSQSASPARTARRWASQRQRTLAGLCAATRFAVAWATPAASLGPAGLPGSSSVGTNSRGERARRPHSEGLCADGAAVNAHSKASVSKTPDTRRPEAPADASARSAANQRHRQSGLAQERVGTLLSEDVGTTSSVGGILAGPVGRLTAAGWAGVLEGRNNPAEGHEDRYDGADEHAGVAQGRVARHDGWRRNHARASCGMARGRHVLGVGLLLSCIARRAVGARPRRAPLASRPRWRGCSRRPLLVRPRARRAAPLLPPRRWLRGPEPPAAAAAHADADGTDCHDSADGTGRAGGCMRAHPLPPHHHHDALPPSPLLLAARPGLAAHPRPARARARPLDGRTD
eukprot:scaffold1650_cov351-Prasinococcus_capsulatus_cf.AAC.8